MRLLFLLILFLHGSAHAQPLAPMEGLTLRFVPGLHGKTLQLAEVDSSPDSLCITTLRFYLTRFSLWQEDKKVWEEEAGYHLLDAAQPEGMDIILKAAPGEAFNRVRFLLGVDSATNAAGAQGGALDAANGMYWAWHSGYINLKLEGISPLCNTRKHRFQFHLGGFRNGALCVQEIELPVDAAAREQNILVDVDALLAQLDLAARPTLMSPGEDAVKLSRAAVKMFRTP